MRKCRNKLYGIPHTFTHILLCITETEEHIPEPQVAMPAMTTSTGWEDPTEVNWGGDEEEEETEEPIVPEPKEAIFKCTALYSYTVCLQSGLPL